jgi:hypothetical protein
MVTANGIWVGPDGCGEHITDMNETPLAFQVTVSVRGQGLVTLGPIPTVAVQTEVPIATPRPGKTYRAKDEISVCFHVQSGTAKFSTGMCRER